MAIASPPERHCIDLRVRRDERSPPSPRMEAGMAVSGIAVVRQFRRKAKSTTATTMTASSSTIWEIVNRTSRMKLACSGTGSDRLFIPGGGFPPSPAGSARFRVSGRPYRCRAAFPHGDNDGWFPCNPASPRLNFGANSTFGDLAQVDRRVAGRRHHQIAQVVQAGAAADVADQVFARILVRDILLRSVDAELRQRAFELGRSRRSAPAAPPDCGETRYCLTSPPIGITCAATPGMASRRGAEARNPRFAQLHRGWRGRW